jgi:serine/threonine-protein kinase
MPFLVMDLLKGEELGSLLARRKTLPSGEVVLYLFEAALALDKTHAAGIVHRDLKPENLFVTRRDDGSPCIKVFDFGIAKIVDRGSKRPTRAMGTPLYMAPEQIRGDGSLGPPVDLYAIGHIAYTLLVGEAYWHEEIEAGHTLFATLSTILLGVKEPPRARARRRRGVELPPAFDAWFLKATALLPEDRFQLATDTVAALAVALGVSLPRVGLATDPPPAAAMQVISGGGIAPPTDVPAGVIHTSPQVPPTELMGAAITKSNPAPVRRGKTLFAGAAMIATAIVVAAGIAALALRGAPSSGEPGPAARSGLTKLLPAPPAIESAPSEVPAPAPASASAPLEVPDAGAGSPVDAGQKAPPAPPRGAQTSTAPWDPEGGLWSGHRRKPDR